MKGLMKYHCLF